MIRFYQRHLSPLWRVISPSQCCFTPSCSEYGKLAMEKHGLVKGALKTTWRILRCNPWSKGGIDLP